MRDTTCSVPDAESRGRECAAPSQSSEIPNSVTSVSRLNQAREYLVDQLKITATHLAEKYIFRKDPELPLCQLCLMTGHGGRPIPHLKSCEVGSVLAAIEQLGQPSPMGRPLTSWDHGDFASSTDGAAR